MKGKLYNGVIVNKKLDNLIKYILFLVVLFVKCFCIYIKGILRVFRF